MAVQIDLGEQLARELREEHDTPNGHSVDPLDQSWMHDNPDLIPAPPHRPLNWTALKDGTPDPRQWAIRDWLPMGATALLAGRGGIGKTLLAQTLGTCIALNLEYFAETPEPRRVLFWAGEDDHDELWRRQIEICAWANVKIETLTDRFIVHDYAGTDLTLAATVMGTLVQTPLMTELHEQVHDTGAEVVFLDSVARIFGGNENDRHQVTTFLSWLKAACGDAAVCLIGHPGKATGAEYSGNTAWEASARARLYLGTKLPDEEPDDKDADAPDDSVRYLARRKANYSGRDWVKLEYKHGVLQTTRPPGETNNVVRLDKSYVEDTVLRAVRRLAEQQIHVTASTASPTYLPKIAKQYDLLDRVSPSQFAAAMRQLQLDGKLTNRPVGTYANRTPKMGLTCV